MNWDIGALCLSPYLILILFPCDTMFPGLTSTSPAETCCSLSPWDSTQRDAHTLPCCPWQG